MIDHMSKAFVPISVALIVAIRLASFVEAQDDVSLNELEQQALKAAADAVAPSVVKIETVGGLEKVGGVLVSTGPTTGLIVDEAGYIVSSAFNFIQKPTSILATLHDGSRRAASVVARDDSRMLVLLKVDVDAPLPVPTVAPRGEIVVGQWAVAVGRALAGDEASLSVGIVSAVDRIWNKAIQTDANISPANYGGPLVDINGRVMGVLVPLSPQGQSDVAGAEWYDSGIGFAIPLGDILARLDQLKQGDMNPGLMGIALDGNDLYGGEAIVGVCQPNSPAYDAGLKAGDKIVEANGTPIRRQAELKHALGPLYAGDEVRLVVLRDNERLEKTFQLTDKLLPYEHPYLGILPKRAPIPESGVVVRYVDPDGPAGKSGVMAGDTIVSIDNLPIEDADDLRQKIAGFEPAATIQLRFEREGQGEDVEVKLGNLPTNIPDSLPPSHSLAEEPAEEARELGKLDIKLPEEPGECLAYVPLTYDPRLPHGLLVWLQAPGKFDGDALIKEWSKLCDQQNVILLAPQSKDQARWLPTETAFVRKTIENVLSRFNVDRNRVVVYGYQGGGAMAYLVGFSFRDLVRGVAVVDAAVPVRAPVPLNEPLQRLAIYTTSAEKSPLAERIKSNVEQLQEAKFPVTVKELGPNPRPLDDGERAGLLRWLDTLDRI